MSEPHLPDRTSSQPASQPAKQPASQLTDEEQQALRQFEIERAESRERYREKLSPFDWRYLRE